jgi:oligoendopeptidase F
MSTVQTFTKPARKFLPQQFEITTWEALAPYYDQLLAETPVSLAEFEQWLRNVDELHAVMQEDLGWRYINMTRNTQDAPTLERYQYFLEHISPKAAMQDNSLARKLYDSPFSKQLKGPEYAILLKLVGKDIELFREENVPLISKLDLMAQQYGAINAAQTLTYAGRTLTMQQAGAYLEKDDRNVREEVWYLMSQRQAQDRDKLEELYDSLVATRHQVALNAGLKSYTDYKFKELGRFDYTKEDCLRFHRAIETAMVPMYGELMENRRERLRIDRLRPWDLNVDPYGREPLKPFKDDQELAHKTIHLFARINPQLRDMVQTLHNMGHLDLGSRVGKAPGGYNYPLNETGVPFIFMNAVGTQSDLTTMVHECGHAVHSFLTRTLPLSTFKNVPSEIAELASMSMELITMDYWDDFYPTGSGELRRAKIQQILRTLTILPWIATIDAFQMWVYDNPGHTRAERRAMWLQIHHRFFKDYTDWSGLEEDRAYRWHRQLHLFEVPFYYIEYGMAQLGALQVWRNFKQDPQKGLAQYLEGLKLGYTRPIGQVYAAAGVRFDFSEEMLRDLLAFVREELRKLDFYGHPAGYA